MLEGWDAGGLGYKRAGMLEEGLGCWRAGMLEDWDAGGLGYGGIFALLML